MIMKQLERLLWAMLRWVAVAICWLIGGLIGAFIATAVLVVFLGITRITITDLVELVSGTLVVLSYLVTGDWLAGKANTFFINFSWNKKVKPEMSVSPT